MISKLLQRVRKRLEGGSFRRFFAVMLSAALVLGGIGVKEQLVTAEELGSFSVSDNDIVVSGNDNMLSGNNVMLQGEGSGLEITPTEPRTDAGVYQISSAAELYWFAGLVNGDAAIIGEKGQNLSANAVLTSDIVINSGVLDADGGLAAAADSLRKWIPIANGKDGYTGTFDGQGHTISGLYIDSSDAAARAGLFGFNAGTVQSIGIIDSYIKGASDAGAIAGLNKKTIQYCYNTGTVEGGNTGGICGNQQGGTTQYCYNTGKITGSVTGGGICGVSGYSGDEWKGIIQYCMSSNGEICGQRFDTTIKECYTLAKASSIGALEMSSDAFSSGEAAYRLNLLSKTYDSKGENVWHQKLGENGDASPVLLKEEGNTVYGFGRCPKVDVEIIGNINEAYMLFTNDGNAKPTAHTYVNGICSYCKGKDNTRFEEIDGIYQIGTADQLFAFAALVNSGDWEANAVLTADIVINSGVLDTDGGLKAAPASLIEWIPIANSDNGYTGTFDGQGHTISGLYINSSDAEARVGLFGFNAGTVQNIGIIDSYIKGAFADAGAIAGRNGGTIQYCYNTGTVEGGNTGGICGNQKGGTTQYCYNTGKITGSVTGGGICGVSGYNEQVWKGIIRYCMSSNTVESSQHTGKICGQEFDTTIEECYTLAKASSIGALEMSSDAFSSGEAAYRLNLLSKTYDSKGENVWYQKLGENGDASPVLLSKVGNTVYGFGRCPDVDVETIGNINETYMLFTNDSGAEANDHTYQGGICRYCGTLKVPEQAMPKDEDGRYTISSADELDAFSALVNSDSKYASVNAVLLADIVYNENVLADAEGNLNSNSDSFRVWTPIAGAGKDAYAGTFDGQGHTISGLYFNNDEIRVAGLFGSCKGTIKKVGIVDTFFHGSDTIGGIAGSLSSPGIIQNCYFRGTITGKSYLGGICGSGYDYAKIKYCYAVRTGKAENATYDGLITGYRTSWMKVDYCYNQSGEALSSGEAAYTMNDYYKKNGGTETIWYQNLDEGEPDPYPVFDSTHGKVYQVGTNSPYSYANSALYIVTLTSKLSSGSSGSVAELQGGGTIKGETQHTIKAPAKDGLSFLGWYQTSDTSYSSPVSKDLEYTFAVTENISLVAVYKANDGAKLTATGSSVKVNGSGGTNQKEWTYAVGTKIQLTTSADNFLYWKNDSGKIVSRASEYTFTLLGNTSLTAVYKGVSEGTALVEFVSDYGQVIQAETYTADSIITMPVGPSKLGYTFKNWDKTAEQIKEALASGSHITVKPVYEALTKTYNVTVTYDGGAQDTYSNCTAASLLTVKAKTVAGKKFSHWSNAASEGDILSTGENYTFCVSSDAQLYAIYVDQEAVVEKAPAIAVTAISASSVDTKKKISFSVTRDVPEGYTVLEHGVLYDKTGTSTYTEESMVMGATNVKKATSTGTEAKGIFTANLGVSDTNTKIYLRGYMIVRNNETGNIETIYSKLSSKCYDDVVTE